MRKGNFGRVLPMAMAAGIALTVSACGHHGDTSNISNGDTEQSKNNLDTDNVINANQSSGSDLSGTETQDDAANGMTVSGHGGSNAMGNGPL